MWNRILTAFANSLKSVLSKPNCANGEETRK
jgi:hypothetical protein